MDGMLDVLRPVNASIHVALHAGWDGARLWPILLFLLSLALVIATLSLYLLFLILFTLLLNGIFARCGHSSITNRSLISLALQP
jgi:hypothetical protein